MTSKLTNKKWYVFSFFFCLVFVLVFMVDSYAAEVKSDNLPAFPGAEGFGSTTPGGRGGCSPLVSPGRRP